MSNQDAVPDAVNATTGTTNLFHAFTHIERTPEAVLEAGLGHATGIRAERKAKLQTESDQPSESSRNRTSTGGTDGGPSGSGGGGKRTRAASYRAACLVKVTEGGMRAREWVRRGFRGLHSSRAPDLEGPVRSGCPLLPPVQWIGCSEAIRKSSNMDTSGYHFRRPHRHPSRRPRHHSTLLMMMNLALLQAQPSITTRSRSRYNCRPCDRAVSAAFRFTSLSDCYNKCELAAA